MTDVDVPLLRKAVEWAEAEAAKPAEECGWYQASYVMPVRHGDGSPVAFFGEDDSMILKSEEINGCGTAFCIAGWVYWQATGAIVLDSLGRAPDVDTFARKALGITSAQASDLFSGCNSIDRVRSVAEEIAGERL